MFLTTLPVELLSIAERTVAGEAVGCSCRYSATAPETIGAATEVPFQLASATSE